MTEETLRRRIERHNSIQLLTACVLFPGSLLLWFLSFWVFRFVIYLLLFVFGFHAWGFSGFVSLVVLGLMVYHALRFKGPAAKVGTFFESLFGDSFLGRQQSFGVDRDPSAGPMTYVYLVAKLVFAAPRATVQAIRALRSRIQPEPAMIAQALQAFEKLDKPRRWMRVSELAGVGGGLFLLDRLEMLWTKIEDGEQMVRIPAGSRPADFQ